MILLYDTGARIQEMLNVRLCDFRYGKCPTITLDGKGGKLRTVPLMEKTMEHLHLYLSVFHPIVYDTEQFLFYAIIHGERNPLSDDCVRKFIKQYVTAAREECLEVPIRVYPHLWRHSRAMHLYQQNNPYPTTRDRNTFMKWYHGYQSTYDRQCRCTPLSYSSSEDIYFDDDFLDRYSYVDVPQDERGLGTFISYMGWHMTTRKGAPSTELKLHAQDNGRYSESFPEYYALVDGRIVIATKASIGGMLDVAAGDYLDVTFQVNGVTTLYHTIVGEEKGNDAPNPWGHYDGKGIIEIVYPNYSPPE